MRRRSEYFNPATKKMLNEVRVESPSARISTTSDRRLPRVWPFRRTNAQSTDSITARIIDDAALMMESFSPSQTIAESGHQREGMQKLELVLPRQASRYASSARSASGSGVSRR